MQVQIVLVSFPDLTSLNSTLGWSQGCPDQRDSTVNHHSQVLCIYTLKSAYSSKAGQTPRSADVELQYLYSSQLLQQASPADLQPVFSMYLTLLEETQSSLAFKVYSTRLCTDTHECYRPYPHKLLTINNYINCLSNFAFSRSFHLPIFEKILMRIRSIACLYNVCIPVVICQSKVMEVLHHFTGLPEEQLKRLK